MMSCRAFVASAVFFCLPVLQVMAQPFTVDPGTSLLLHFDNSVVGAQGQPPVSQSGVSYAQGVFGACIRVNGGTTLQYGTAGNIIADQGSIEFWIKPHWAGNDNTTHIFFSLDNELSLGKDGANNFYFIIKTPLSEAYKTYPAGTWRSGDWHHIAVVWNVPGYMKSYIDGIERISHSADVGDDLITTMPERMTVGARLGAFTADADIDELRISTIPRSADEILAGYQRAFSAGSAMADAPSWEWKNPVPNNNTLQSVSFSDRLHGTIVGEAGMIMRTVDGGQTWTSQESGADETLTSVHFTSQNTGTAVGEGGVIIHTEDGGVNWIRIANPDTSLFNLSCVHFPDPLTGYAVGDWGTVLKSSDAGKTWIQLANPFLPDVLQLRGVHFLDAEHGIIVGQSGVIAQTTNGGASWATQAYVQGETLNGVAFADSQIGVIISENGTILRTTDGGANWDARWSGYFLGFKVHFYNTTLGIITAESGAAIITTDAGNTWTPVNVETGSHRNQDHDVVFTDMNTAVAVGEVGKISRSTDGGATWSRLGNGQWDPSSIRFVPRRMRFVSDGKGIAIGEVPGNSIGPMMRTTDGGNTWSLQEYDFQGWVAGFTGLSLPDTSTGYAVATGMKDFFLKTSDGGATWNEMPPVPASQLTGVCFNDSDAGTIITDNGEILHTTDGGISWHNQASPVNTGLWDIQYFDSNIGTAVGRDGVILHTTDGGTTWVPQSSGTSSNLRQVQVIDDRNSIVLGEFGTLLRTTDGGQTWMRLNVPSAHYISPLSIDFTDPQHGMLVGEYLPRPNVRGTGVFKTSDGGNTWENVRLHCEYTFTSACHTADEKVVISGEKGTVIVSPHSKSVKLNVLTRSLNYGTCAVGDSVSKDVSIQNAGSIDLIIDRCTIAGQDADEFNIRTNEPVTVGPHSVRTISITFLPKTPGTKSAFVILTSNDPALPKDTILIEGYSLSPEIELSSSVMDFGIVALGTTVSRTLRIANRGTSDLVLDTLVTIGPNQESYLMHYPDTRVLPPDSTLGIQVDFSPKDTGRQIATIIIRSNDISTPAASVTLEGAGVQDPPNIVVSHDTLDFGSVTVGTNLEMSIMLRNTGMAALHISAITVTGNDASDFHVITGTPISVAPRDSQRVRLEYHPSRAGQETVTLSIASDDPDEPLVSIPLQGTGTPAGHPVISPSDVSLDFGTVNLMQASVRTLEVRNNGTGSLVIDSEKITGQDSVQFHMLTALPQSIPPGDSSSIQLEFRPAVLGMKSATLVINSNDPQNPSVHIQLAGIGAQTGTPSIQLSANQIDFGPVQINSQRTMELSISNVGNAPLLLYTPNISGSDSLMFSANIGNQIVQPYEATKVLVAFSPTSAGGKTSLLTIQSNDPVQPKMTIPLRGNGTTDITVTEPPSTVLLKQNYPNPFSTRTFIQYQVSEPGHVLLEILDPLGRRSELLVDDYRDPGMYQVTFVVSPYVAENANGVFYCRLAYNRHVEIIKMVRTR